MTCLSETASKRKSDTRLGTGEKEEEGQADRQGELSSLAEAEKKKAKKKIKKKRSERASADNSPLMTDRGDLWWLRR